MGRVQKRHLSKALGWVTTDCEKRSYVTRRDAEASIRQQHEPGLRPYPCEDGCGLWHVGHLPKLVRRGELTAAEFYQARRAEAK